MGLWATGSIGQDGESNEPPRKFNDAIYHTATDLD